jgi:hypothetical protein
MGAATSPNPRRELARRVGAGFEVALFWDAADDSTSIEIWHPVSQETLRFIVPTEDALDAFYHPFAHLRIAAAA